jgi:hypothetical protein
MTILWLVTLILGAGLAVASGQGAKWKLLNVVIILGCMGIGCLSWLCGRVRQQKFWNRPQPGFTTLYDVRNRGSTRMLVAE